MSSTAIAFRGNISNDFIHAPNWINATAMGASSAASITIPTGAALVELRGNVDFFVKWGSTAVSTAAATDGTASEVVTAASGGVRRNIGASTAISIMSTAAAATVTQAWWTL